MKTVLKTLAALSLGAVTLVPAARAADVVETGKNTENVKVTNERFVLVDKDMTTIHFEKGSANLSKGDREALKHLATTLNKEAKVDKLIVAAWSDKETPKGDAKLTDAERDLAKKRADNVEKALKDDHAASVTTYNMAEAPGWFAKEFNTEQSLVKGTSTAKQETKSDKDAVLAEIGQKIRAHGGPGTAVVIAKFKHEVVAH